MENKHYDWYYELSYCREKPRMAHNEVLIQVPFMGTYGALDELINSEVERDAEWLTENPQEGYEDGFYASFDMYSFLTDYVGEIRDICQLPSLTFQYLSSPREYNFYTDKIICSVDKDELMELYNRVCNYNYGKAVTEATKPRSGYVPYFHECDLYYHSTDDFPDNSAALGLILDAHLNEWLNNKIYEYNENFINTFELFLQLDCYDSLNEYLHY